MQALSKAHYEELRQNACVLEDDSHGDKVLRLQDGSFLKLFRRKRWLTSAALWPYAARFASNAQKLQQLGLPCPQIINTYRICAIARDAVHYQPLAGRTLRQLEEEELNPQLFGELGRFIAQLHQQGIYFRSLHLGNIVLTPDHRLGLIDIADLQKSARALGRHKRLRNFRHLSRDRKDHQLLTSPQAEACFVEYLRHSPLRMDAQALRSHLLAR
ncbi:lipopolysaccharide kinase InaA family protein [Pseudomonas xionganensis]|uniref:Toluene tolerance protein n=1 Tax=Pseudomonas xionganensis TaxID=2654845 RepID=A0A6I4KSD0_9PSED|nr:lipopolysaccharide kinase InaA family protein [Pseudomonas xionganensis]MVW74638.1 toluene tolerance protein [Pseudomonas xionganensis]